MIAIRVVCLLCLGPGYQLVCPSSLLANDEASPGTPAEAQSFYASLPDGPSLTDYTPYCGLRCVSIAASSLGQPVSFRSLLAPEFVGKQGSSGQQLLNAAKSIGLVGRAASRLTYFSLHFADGPVLLHVKPNVTSADYSHWVLLCAWDEADCLVTDGRDSAPERISAGKLRAIWDGNAILLSKAEPPAILPLRLAGILQATGYILTALLVSGFVRVGYGFLCTHAIRGSAFAFPVRVVLGASLLATIAGALVVCADSCRWIGFLDDAEVISRLAEYHAPDFLRAVSLGEMERLVSRPGRTVVIDTRWQKDFAQGHIPGAVNIEPNTKPHDCAKQLSRVPLASPIVVYCNMPECPYSREISRRLLEVGYRNVRIFHGGWQKWTSRH